VALSKAVAAVGLAERAGRNAVFFEVAIRRVPSALAEGWAKTADVVAGERMSRDGRTSVVPAPTRAPELAVQLFVGIPP